MSCARRLCALSNGSVCAVPVNFLDMVDHIEVDGRSVAFTIVGEGADLVMLNGFAATVNDWDPGFVDCLAESNRLLLVEHRGMGESSDDGHAFSIGDLADDVSAVIAEQVEGPAAVLGWSMGGYVAQQLAVSNPSQVGRLVLLSTDAGGQRSDYVDDGVLAEIANVDRPSIEQAKHLLALLFPPAVAEAVFAQYGQLVADARAELRADVLSRQLSAIREWRGGASPFERSRPTCPVLVATGTEDAVIPSVNARRLVGYSTTAWLA
ncbi:MAG: alpha/beta fold hydrolase, partial [Candidatus Nanopelagicales bacterium]